MEQKKDFSFRELFESPSKNRSRQEPWYYALLLYLVIFISLMSLVNVALQASYASSQLKKIKQLEENLATVSDSLHDNVSEIKKAVVPTTSDTQTPTDPEKTASDSTGIITGSLSYPSQFVPKDMKVCAVDIETEEEICTTEHIEDKKYKSGVGYTLELPVGTYHIYAHTNMWPAYKAYYNEFVTCGLKAGCPSHENISVQVKADQTLTDIDPTDWYDV